jgi:hypothetical protein
VIIYPEDRLEGKAHGSFRGEEFTKAIFRGIILDIGSAAGNVLPAGDDPGSVE